MAAILAPGAPAWAGPQTATLTLRMTTGVRVPYAVRTRVSSARTPILARN